MILLLVAAWAERPFPDYDEELITATWNKLDSLIEAACQGPTGPGRLCSDEPLDEAIARGNAFQTQVVPDARITYMVGLAHLSKGEKAEAKRRFEQAVAMDPARIDAWHDLGEIALGEGDYDLAARAFTEVAERLATGPRSWLGPWRLAEVAAHRHDAAVFEREMLVALERGFSFRFVRGLPTWRGFLADPEIGPSVRKLLTVYGTPDVLESLERG